MNTELVRLRDFVASNPAGSFMPKLNDSQRIAMFALYKEGASTTALARIFGVHRNTVHSLVHENSARYRKTRDAYYGLGAEKAFEQHVTPAMVDALTKARETKLTLVSTNKDKKPNPKADHRKGKWENLNGEIFQIDWIEESDQPQFFGPGWYPIYDGQPALPLGREEPFYTSAEAYKEGRKL